METIIVPSLRKRRTVNLAIDFSSRSLRRFYWIYFTVPRSGDVHIFANKRHNKALMAPSYFSPFITRWIHSDLAGTFPLEFFNARSEISPDARIE